MSAKKVMKAPADLPAKGPYSQAVKCGQFLFVSGQLPLDPATGQVVAGGIEEQTRRTLENLQLVITGCGGKMDDVLKTTCYLAEMGEFPRFNAIYAEYFPQDPPARATVQAARLPLDVRVEVEAVVALE